MFGTLSDADVDDVVAGMAAFERDTGIDVRYVGSSSFESDLLERLRRGARVADIGCGHGASTIAMAQAFPRSSFIGLDYHDAAPVRGMRYGAAQENLVVQLQVQQ